MRTIERVRGSLNPRLEIQGVVLTMYDRRNSLSEQVAKDVRAHFGDKVYDAVIPVTSASRRRRRSASPCCSTI
jgi:chromosome partitioning protein